VESTSNWEGISPSDGRVKFEADDFEIMDLALDQARELRICAAAVRAARHAGLKYPMESSQDLIGLLGGEKGVIEGHLISELTVSRYLSKEFFPIESESELITRCYVALMRCRDDVQWAARAPDYAMSLIEETKALGAVQGGGQ